MVTDRDRDRDRDHDEERDQGEGDRREERWCDRDREQHWTDYSRRDSVVSCEFRNSFLTTPQRDRDDQSGRQWSRGDRPLDGRFLSR